MEDFRPDDPNDWFGHTTLHPVGLSVVIALSIAMFLLPKRWMFAPMVLLACFVSSAQRIVVAGLDFDFLRILTLAGFLRLALRAELRGLKWNRIDTCLVLFAVIGASLYSIQRDSSEALVNRLGWAYDTLGFYFLFRFVFGGDADPRRVAQVFTLAAVPAAAFFAIEWVTHMNLFSVFGGVPAQTWLRDGRLRCQGPFTHPIMAGVFWASVLPIVLSLWWSGRRTLRVATSPAPASETASIPWSARAVAGSRLPSRPSRAPRSTHRPAAPTNAPEPAFARRAIPAPARQRAPRRDLIVHPDSTSTEPRAARREHIEAIVAAPIPAEAPGAWKLWAAVGSLAILFIVAATNSSTSVMGAVFALAATFAFPLRGRMRLIRWATFFGLCAIHIVMKKGAWYLLAHATVFDASTGWHRYFVIDQTIHHFGDWWLMGTKTTTNWNVTDITNEYAWVAIEGGLFALLAFLGMIVFCFARVGAEVKRRAGDVAAQRIAWGLGCALFVHCMSFIGVSYFGQSRMGWFLLLGLIASFGALAADKVPAHATLSPLSLRSSRPSGSSPPRGRP